MSKKIMTRLDAYKNAVHISSIEDQYIDKILDLLKTENIFEKAKNIKILNEPKHLSARSKLYWGLRGYDDQLATILSKSRMPGQYAYYRIYKNQNIEDSINSVCNYSKSCAMTLESMIKKYGNEIGVQKWNTYCTIQKEKNTFEFKKKKYGWTEYQFKEFNASRAVTKKNLINRWGLTDGLNKWKSYCDRQSYTKSKQYFIDTYGVIDGIKEYSRINSTKLNNLESFIYKYGEEKGKEYYRKYKESIPAAYSKIANDMFDRIAFKFGNLNEIYYYNSNNGEKSFINNEKGNLYMVDFYIKPQNKIIEFFGDYWHCHESLFPDETQLIETPTKSIKTVKDKRIYDNERIKFLKEKVGENNVLVVWESEYRKNKEYIIEKCVNFINNID